MKSENHAKLPISIVRVSVADMMTLHARTGDPEHPPPMLLYQDMPESAMTLMATIPNGMSALSIGQQSGAFTISISPPPEGDGYVIVYAHKPNGRYEAVEVLYRGQSFSLVQFRDVACKWVQTNLGRLGTEAGRYAYFAPTRDQWGIIQRDEGYTVLDPSTMVFEVTPELIEKRNGCSSSGVLARIPVQTGNRHPRNPACVFAGTELTLDAVPNSGSPWIGFVEWQRIRAMQSRPPAPIVPHFREWLKLLGSESGIVSWNFRQGMFFNDHIEWWGGKRRRRTLHEGIDFAERLLSDGSIQNVPEGMPVRAMADGEVVSFLDDFLNKTAVVRHPAIRNEKGDFFYILFSHIHPNNGTAGPIIKGQILGTVCKTKPAGAPVHLHLTGAWVPESIAAEQISMDLIHPAFMPIVLINFNSLITGG